MPAKTPSRTSRHRDRPDPLAKRVGERIRALRKEQGIDWDAWVEECQLGRGTLSEVERGLLPPGLHALAKIARALGVSIADLVAGTTERERLFIATRDLAPSDVRDLLALAEERRRQARAK